MMRSQFLNQLNLFLVGQFSRRELETWLVLHLQEILDSGDAETIELANKVDADLIEFNEGFAEEAELRERWEGYILLAETIVTDNSQSPERIKGESLATTVRHTFRVGMHVGTPGSRLGGATSATAPPEGPVATETFRFTHEFTA